MMMIKMLEKAIHQGQVFEEGEVRSVPEALGKKFCELGWAEDVDGAVATGDRDLRPQKIDPVDMVLHTR